VHHVGFIIQCNLGSRTPLITNKSVHEQIFLEKKSRVTNGVSSNERASWQQWLATSWEYWHESVSCCVTFAQYTVSVYEHFGWQTASRNELSSWTEVPLYWYSMMHGQQNIQIVESYLKIEYLWQNTVLLALGTSVLRGGCKHYSLYCCFIKCMCLLEQ
jgi:hypothetical protein